MRELRESGESGIEAKAMKLGVYALVEDFEVTLVPGSSWASANALAGLGQE